MTEQWKKGELPSGYYYVKNEFGNIFPSDYSEDYDCISDTVIKDFFTEVSEIKEVLEPVPSYEEWKEYQELDEEYKKNVQLAIRFSIEADILKELLKECRGLFNRATVDGAEPNNAELIEILTKIDEVLK